MRLVPGEIRRNNRRVWLAFACAGVLLFPVQSRCDTNTVYSFLRSDVSARAAAMAGSVLTVTNDPSMLFYNPASLSTLHSTQGSIGFFKHILDINSGHVSYCRRIADVGYFGAGVLFTNYGSFQERDEVGNVMGSFGASDLAVTLGYATELEKGLHVGGAMKFIYSSIAGYSSTGLAIDAGMLWLIPETRVGLGASIRNLGVQLSPYYSTRERLPLDVALGGSISPKGLPLLLHVGVHRLAEDAGTFADRLRAFSVGGEFTVSPAVQLRFGYDNAERRDLKIGSSSDLAGFSAGLGIWVAGYRVDYALSSLGKAGSLHRVSLTTSL
jgi:hypothetical protein